MGLLLLRSTLRDAAIDGLRLVTLTRACFAERLDLPEVGFAPQYRTFSPIQNDPGSCCTFMFEVRDRVDN